MKRTDLHTYVISRDQSCVVAEVNLGHVCKDEWGHPHLATDVRKLTLGHIKEHPGGMRRDEPGWCIAQCSDSNIAHEETNHDNRIAIRAYLLGIRRQEEMER